MKADMGRSSAQRAPDQQRTGDGCYESAVLDPDGHRIEITA